jgi:putative FmdB family regulatory protein
MPLYPFHCGNCGREFEQFLRPGEAARGIPCPSCGRATLPESREPAPEDPAASPGPVCGLPKGT